MFDGLANLAVGAFDITWRVHVVTAQVARGAGIGASGGSLGSAAGRGFRRSVSLYNPSFSIFGKGTAVRGYVFSGSCLARSRGL